MATEMLKGKTAEEASQLNAEELSGDLGALPPMKIHCGQLVEGALKSALDSGENTADSQNTESSSPANTLAQSMAEQNKSAGKIKIIKLDE